MNLAGIRRRIAVLAWLWLPPQIVMLSVRAEGQTAAAAESTSDDSARARPGDRVVLKIWNEPEMSDTFVVAQSGNVILPRLGSTRIDGIPIYELEDSLRTLFATYLRNPSVEVVMLRRISVLGEVREPGIYLADLTMGLPELIARAGGPTENGDARRVTVLRGTERLEFSGRRQMDLFAAELHSGDQVIVSRKNFLVRNPWAAVSTAFTLVTLIRQLGLW